ncbi:unnamed protein product [Mytilus coruscus]|uniref:C1q domain-containing protein n=1 Tax=Mytilus coruscus TaxID=42192 RepID=A0A6J8C251_MYTCO|nr:unnamed protein product [Mytilus coruscus]
MDNMLLKALFLLCFLKRGFGFLLDKNVQSTGGIIPSNNQYLTVSQFYEEKKEQRHMTTELRHDTDQLRNDMEQTFALMTSQFQKQLEILEQKIRSDGCSHNETSQNINLLEQKYRDLGQNYRDLEANNTKLRNEFTDLLTKYTKQEQELQTMRIKILENEEKTEKRLNSMDTRFSSQENKTAEHEKEISELKQLKNLQPLQDLSSIKQKLQFVATETHSLSVNERARSQDFLALYNKTTNIEQITNKKIENYHNMTKTNFNQLERNQNTTYNTLNQKIMDLKQHSETMENGTLVNLNKEVLNIQTNLNKEVLNVQTNLNMSLAQLEQQINHNSRKVAVTSCVSKQKTYNTHTLIKFDDVRTFIGIKNLSAFRTSGKFSCAVEGLYQISVFIASSTTVSTYSIYKNSNKLITTYTLSYRYATTSTGVVVVEMNVGDTISVIPDMDMFIFAQHLSCITIAMIK